jgi:hypothetical protein
MSRDVDLNALKAGITRLRVKGGADPSSLYDLVNGYVTIDGSAVSRPGTVSDVTLPEGTKGLCAFDGGMVVFSHEAKTISNQRYSCGVLINPVDSSIPIKEIHFASPFMGALYVVAEFDGGDVYHYWLQSNEAWQPNMVYRDGQSVRPTVINGFAYTPTRANVPAAWKATTRYAVGDEVTPTVYNGFYYVLKSIDGNNAASGANEPDWVAAEGALVYDDADNTPGKQSSGSGDTSGRYQ